MVAQARYATQPLGLVGRPESSSVSGRLGRYQVLGEIAHGGMSGVHLGLDLHTGDRVALKILDPEIASNADVVARLYAELVVSERVRHPNLLEVHAIGRAADGVPFLVMELLDGDSLSTVVERGPLALEAAVGFGAQIAAGVAALHAVGIVHCDLKPENVIVLAGRVPRVKVIDYGVARFVDVPPTDDDAIAGTPICMAPEQWRGEPERASDVYALGCLLFELATGDQPFAGTIAQLMVAHRDNRPARPSWLRAHVPIELERLILRCLAKEPAMRPVMADVALVLAQLGHTAHELPEPEHPAS